MGKNKMLQENQIKAEPPDSETGEVTAVVSKSESQLLTGSVENDNRPTDVEIKEIKQDRKHLSKDLAKNILLLYCMA